MKWDLASTKRRFLSFFLQRFENILIQEGHKIDEIKCVLANFNGEFYTKRLILDAIKGFRGKEEFKKVVELYKRIDNILTQAKNKGFLLDIKIREDLLLTEPEKALYYKTKELSEKADHLWVTKRFDMIIKEFSDLKPTLDHFFDKVLVFDKDKDVATNRLAILNYLLTIFKRIGSFDNIQL